jgi:hypothetical protein
MIGKTINACLSKVATFSTIILITIALSLLGCKGSTVEVKNLPWQISLNEAGQVEVFDVTLGKSTLTEAVNQWRVEAKVALFESPEGEQSLEGYFGLVKLGPFSAQMVARIEVSPEEMEKFVAGRVKRAPMPSGVKRYKLKSEHLRQAYGLVVSEITYIPLISSDDKLLQQRFGEPVERQDLAEGRSLWFYPKKGVVVILDENDKEVFQYFNPENYQRVRARLAAGKAKQLK